MVAPTKDVNVVVVPGDVVDVNHHNGNGKDSASVATADAAPSTKNQPSTSLRIGPGLRLRADIGEIVAAKAGVLKSSNLLRETTNNVNAADVMWIDNVQKRVECLDV